ncbi:MAG TPA: hypothetical protein PLY32_06190 [Salinivirgaceae bacterium]|nr:hypothetical protein [Salinivirgaceae bacterium]HQA76694.1 hypothetical protein [Salinivirgaceae bacterium]
MKKQGIIELTIAIAGIIILLVFQNEWSYIPLIIFGVLSVALIRKKDLAWTDEEKRCMKKRNLLSIIAIPFFAIICYFSANDALMNNFLWILLTVYLFLAAHGILFMAPLNTFGNEKQ